MRESGRDRLGNGRLAWPRDTVPVPFNNRIFRAWYGLPDRLAGLNSFGLPIGPIDSLDNSIRFQAPQFVSESAAVDFRQPATQFGESFRVTKSREPKFTVTPSEL
jgi:hypothetical protein